MRTRGALCGESAAVVIGEADPGLRFGAISLLRRAKGGLRRHFGAKTLLIGIREALTIEKRLRSFGDIRYLKENLLYLQKRVGFRRKRAGLRFNVMVPKGEGGGQWPPIVK